MAAWLAFAATLTSAGACSSPSDTTDVSADADAGDSGVLSPQREAGANGASPDASDARDASDATDAPESGPISDWTGQILYHSYSSYAAWDGQLYLFRFADKSVTCLSCGWNIDHAINAVFSPDGTSIAFMGSIHGLQTWDVWTYVFGAAAPTNLTHARKLVNQDPKFSPDGSKIVFKEGHWDATRNALVFQLKEMDRSGAVLHTITDGAVEASMPYYTADGANVVYAAGVGASSAIHAIALDGTHDRTLQSLAGVQEYYPVVRDGTSFLYTRWVSATNANDQVYVSDFSGNTSALPFDEPGSNYSDAFPIGSRYVVMSSTRGGGKGGFDVYIADLTTGAVTSLDALNPSANTANDELGSCFTPQ